MGNLMLPSHTCVSYDVSGAVSVERSPRLLGSSVKRTVSAAPHADARNRVDGAPLERLRAT